MADFQVQAKYWADKRHLSVEVAPWPTEDKGLGVVRLLSGGREIQRLEVVGPRGLAPTLQVGFMNPDSLEELEVSVEFGDRKVRRPVLMDFGMSIDPDPVPQFKPPDKTPDTEVHVEEPLAPCLSWKMGDLWPGDFASGFHLFHEGGEAWALQDPETFFPVWEPERQNLLGDNTVKEFPADWKVVANGLAATPIAFVHQDLGVYGLRCRNTGAHAFAACVSQVFEVGDDSAFWFCTYYRTKDWDGVEDRAKLNFIVQEQGTGGQWHTRTVPMPLSTEWDLFRHRFELEGTTKKFRIGLRADSFDGLCDMEPQWFLPTLTLAPCWTPMLGQGPEPASVLQAPVYMPDMSQGRVSATLEWVGGPCVLDFGFLSLKIGDKVQVCQGDTVLLSEPLTPELGFEPQERVGGLWYDREVKALLVQTETGPQRLGLKPGTQSFSVAWADGVVWLFVNGQKVGSCVGDFGAGPLESVLTVQGQGALVLWALEVTPWSVVGQED